MRPFLEHTQRLEDAFSNLDSTQAFAFGAACAERQWAVYAKAVEGKPWGRPALLQAALQGVWDWLMGVSSRPQGFLEQCDEAVPEEIEDDAAGAAREVAGSFLSLVYAVEKDKPSECRQVAFNGLNIVEAFVYEFLGLAISTENDLFVDDHELVQGEMKRQADDFRLVSAAPLSHATIKELRERSQGLSILSNY